MKQKTLKTTKIKTPFGVWEITEMNKMGTLKFLSLKSGEKLIIQSDRCFRSVRIGDLVAWRKFTTILSQQLCKWNLLNICTIMA